MNLSNEPFNVCVCVVVTIVVVETVERAKRVRWGHVRRVARAKRVRWVARAWCVRWARAKRLRLPASTSTPCIHVLAPLRSQLAIRIGPEKCL